MHESQSHRPSRADRRGAWGQGRPFEAADDLADVDELTRGRRCSPRPTTIIGLRLSHHSDLSLRPATTTHPCGAPHHEPSTRVQAIHPSGLPLACDPRMEQELLGFPPSFAPRPHRRRTSGQGQADRARTRNQHYGISRTSNLAGLLDAYDLASHSWMRKRADGRTRCRAPRQAATLADTPARRNDPERVPFAPGVSGSAGFRAGQLPRGTGDGSAGGRRLVERIEKPDPRLVRAGWRLIARTGVRRSRRR
jgi:hypothetical protein